MSIASGAAGSTSSCEPVTQLDSSAASSPSVELGSLWQRVDQDRWIVGLSVHNRTSRLVDLLMMMKLPILPCAEKLES